MEVRAASRTDVGRSRELNEDSFFAGTHVFAVADGLGGHRAGEVASTLALEPIASLDGLDPERAAAGVADRVRAANRAVHDQADSDAGLKGMGTTMTAVVVFDGRLKLAHVGDSRCYLIRGDSIEQLSRDHTLVARMVSEGKLTPEQADVHPQRSMLTRALGADRDIDVDVAEFALEPGDRLLLCSDGLTGMLSDEEIRTLATDGADLQEICDNLIDEANARGGLDNVTAVVVDVAGSWEAAPAQGRRARRTARAERRERRFSRRALVWVTLIVLFSVGGFVFVRTWTHRSFYVGVQGDRVVIFRGVPVEFAGVRLYETEQATPLRTDEIQKYYLSHLEEGITADSYIDACRIVEQQIPLITKPTPSPEASASAKATPSASPTPIPGCPP